MEYSQSPLPKAHFYPDARILVVDDEPLFLAYLKKILTEDGYQKPSFESDPLVALERLREEPFDLLLLDQNMPHMSGSELLEQLAKMPVEQQVPVMMLTAEDDQSSRRKALALGALDFLTKPFDVVEVTTRIRNMLQVRMLHNALEEMNHNLEETVRARTKQLQREVEERKRIEQKLEYLVATDIQSGLPNEMIFMDRLEQTLRFNRQNKVGTALVGLHILWVEDMAEQENWMRDFSQLLMEKVPDCSVMRNDRLGFLLLHSVEEQAAIELIVRKIETIQADGLYHFKMGFVVDWVGEMSPSQMVSHVRNNLLEERRETQQPTSMKALLHQAIFEHQCAPFELAWQPQILLDGKRVTGVEVLLRWNSPELGFVNPGKLVAIAEQEGWIGHITHWLIESSIRQYRLWMDQGMVLDHFSINLSAQDLLDEECVGWISQQLSANQVPAERLCVELTETKLMENIGRGRERLKEIRALGVQVALDDFGTGYSSLSYLNLFPIDILKIDRSFAVNLLEDDVSMAIIRAMTQLGHHLDMLLVVEGVEYAEQVTMLIEGEVDIIQGYYFSKPLSADDFLAFYRQGVD
ncbi:MAG: EAL domain-containing protein [Gammaproteobacteria bacterium]|jgi:EAL domain-containing protein (putative c-di-GMP-specific phosphodiesterase class I)/DNA-binding response OmpR family regulator|nr:EAL domain-containing protein [Gammaproteobacteria bacterium]MBT7308241.1 EAL domain-containing protein [Gammaproteobacteria bacterium]